MTDTYTNLKYHLIWSTKSRTPLLKHQIRKHMYQYMAGIIKNLEGHPFLINGTSNHVHLLLSLHPTTSISKTVQSIKTGTSKWMNEERQDLQSTFRWQTGYGAFTVSHSRMKEVYDYIERQEEHHQNLTFAEEFQMLLDRHDIAYDSEYIP